MLLSFQAIPDIPDENVSWHIAFICTVLTIGANVLILILRRRARRHQQEQRESDAREQNRKHDAARQRILASGLQGTDDVSKAVFHWLHRREGQTVTVKVQFEKPGQHVYERDIEWTIPPFDVDLRQDCFDHVSRVVYFFNNSQSEIWKFPPETWHEAEASDDKLVYSLGWHLEYAAEFGSMETSATARSKVDEWWHYTLTVKRPLAGNLVSQPHASAAIPDCADIVK